MQSIFVTFLAMISVVTSSRTRSSPNEAHFPRIKHEALRLRDLSETGTHKVSFHQDGVHVDYEATTKTSLVSLLHEAGVKSMNCYENGESVIISVAFDETEALAIAENKLKEDESLISATCAVDGAFHPIYGEVLSVRRHENGQTLDVVAKRVRLRELFSSLSASISVSPRDQKTATRRRLRGNEDDIHWVDGDLNRNDESLGLGDAVYTSNSQPMQVERNFKSLDQSTQDEVRNANVDRDYQIFEGFGFNYDPTTDSAAVSPLSFANGAVQCNNCHANIDDAHVNVEMRFGDLGGPEHVAAWVEGGMGANLEVVVQNPAIAVDDTYTIQEKTQVYTFEFAIGPIPIRWVVYSELLAEVKLDRAIPEGALAARGGVHADLNLKAGVEWTRANGWGQIQDIDFDMGMYPVAVITPDLSTQNTISAKLIPTVTLSLFDAIPFMIRPIPTLGYDFGGDVNQCANNDGYAQFTSFTLGLGVGDIKLPDENGATIVSGFSREFTVYGKTYTNDDTLFGDAVCGPNDKPNFCSGCLSDLNQDKDALIDLFKSVCQSLEGGCDSEQLESSAAMYDLSASDIDSIQKSDDTLSPAMIAVIAGACAVVACAVAIGVIQIRRHRRRGGKPNVRTIHVRHKKKKKKKDAYKANEQV